MVLSYCLTVYVILSCLSSSTEANSRHLPRMSFTNTETAMRFPIPGHHAPVGIVLQREPDNVIAAGQKHLNSFNLQDPQKTPEEINVLWTECIEEGSPRRVRADCNYNISVVHRKLADNKMFLLGTNGRESVCCVMNLAEQTPRCVPTQEMDSIRRSIRDFVIKEGDLPALVESAESADLYITRSGSQEYVGIHKFGKNRVAPAGRDKEQHYVGLVLNKRRDDPTQSKVYAFYREKNRDTGMYSGMWLPFVTRVCMQDTGGPKNFLQFSWTSQMNARLFCGDPDSRQHFSELVDVATVHADQWQETRVYALFRNEWGMSAVCVYTIEDIENIFTTSPFKGSDSHKGRPRGCLADSTMIHFDILRLIEKNSEMEHWVQPVGNSGPLLSNHHNYTHMDVDLSQNKRNTHTVLFLSRNNGWIHKVIQNENQTFVIAEYRPFNNRTHVLSMILNASSRKLYVNSRAELVEVDVANCSQYGHSCEDCILARDPYCGWNRTHCTSETNDTRQDVTHGNHAVCETPPKVVQLHGKVFRFPTDKQAENAVGSIALPPKSKFFLQCPMTSHHATYTWHHLERNTSCDSRMPECIFLINSMGPEQEGTYTCVSEEMGYSRVLAQYQLQLESGAAGRRSTPLVWLCFLAVLIKTFLC